MTVRKIDKMRKEVGEAILSLVILASIIAFGLMLSGEAAEYVKEGFSLALGSVIPSSFPFMILSDLYVAYGKPENIALLRSVFTKLTGMPHIALSPFICGNVGGFPIGAKMASAYYTSGALKRDDAERLMALSNNPSSAFIVGGVGMGIYGDISIGFSLLISVYLSVLICALLTRSKTCKNYFSNNNIKQNYDFISSVKTNGISCISIISFISLFSAGIGIIKKRVKYTPLLYVFLAFSEVTNAIKYFNISLQKAPLFSLTLSAFSLGFGGVCVGMQSAFFAKEAGLKMKKYYLIKLLQGLICGSIFSLIYNIKKQL